MSKHFKSAIRSVKKRPTYSFINIFGLGIGLACFTLIMLFVTDELSYDSFHEDADQIYRVALTGYPPNSPPDLFAMVSSPVGRYIRSDFPEVEAVVRIQGYGPTVLHNGEYFFNDQFYFAEPELFDVFTLPLIYGSKEEQLVRPGTLVMTQSMSKRYFGDQNPVGDSMTLNDSIRVEITGVIQDLPSNSHIQADFFVSYATLLARRPENERWLGLSQYSYLKVAKNIDLSAFADRLRGLAHEKDGGQLAEFGFKVELELEPLTDIYLKSKRDAQIGATGDMTQVWVFSAVAIFVLLLASINFTNLATARSFERAREVGVRKSLGSSRFELIRQFMAESLTMAFAALIIGAILAFAGLSVLNDIAGKSIPYAALFRPQLTLIALLATIACGVLGGAYPAFVLSSFKSVDVLKGVFHASRSGSLVRKELVSAQFAISIALIAGTVIVFQQLQLLRTQDLGFDPDQMLVIDGQTLSHNAVGDRHDAIISSFSTMSGVQKASFSANIPGRSAGRSLITAEGLAEDDVRSVSEVSVGYNYFENFGIALLSGRTYSTDFPLDPDESVIINEETVRYLGFGTNEEAIGKTLGFGEASAKVIGVVGDYYHSSLKVEIQPTIFALAPQSTNFLLLRVAGADAVEVVAESKAEWAALFPGFPFESFFMDDDFNKQYQAEERLMNVFSIFSFLAILIACMGLFGLAAFTAAQRTKEIGIRKVMGASIFSVVKLLSKEFVILVMVGLVVAVPAAVYGMNLWLEPFPIQVPLHWWVFGLAGAGAMIIALVTVGYQAVRAASADPISSLRYE
jgi:putative ABC transport system permease protein